MTRLKLQTDLRPGKPPGPSRLAQAIRAAGFSQEELLEHFPEYSGDISAWCYGRRPIQERFRARLCELIGWTMEQLEEFEQGVGL